MYLRKSRSIKKAVIFLQIALFSVNGVITDTAMPLHNQPNSTHTLGIWSASERDVQKNIRAEAYKKLFETKLAPALGGKSSWDSILEGLSSKIGFHVAPSARISINDIWGMFIDANPDLVKKGNAIVSEANGALAKEDMKELHRIINNFRFPEEAEFLLKDACTPFGDRLIFRSSGRTEDSYENNLAGLFISVKTFSKELAGASVKHIFEDALTKIWLTGHSVDGVQVIEGIPKNVNRDDGVGILIQPFFDFDASGTAMSNLYGHTTIEAVYGDAESAVKVRGASTMNFIFDNSGEEKPGIFPSYGQVPSNFSLKGIKYTALKNYDEILGVMNAGPWIQNMASPIDTETAKEIFRISRALEFEIGVPLDIEWGTLNGRVFIIQIRPMIGDFSALPVKIDFKSHGSSIAETPVAWGHTDEKGITAPAVMFSDSVSNETIQEFEKTFGREYIRIQHDVAAQLTQKSTIAKVLVDPVQGARHAHDVNLLTKRIKQDEFVYCNGPVIKEGLLKNTAFDQAPGFPGIWLSTADVTYLSDGLVGAFYISRNGPSDTLSQNQQDSLGQKLFSELRDYPFRENDGTKTFTDCLELMDRHGLSLIADKYTRESTVFREQDFSILKASIISGQENGGLSLDEMAEIAKEIKDILDLPIFPDVWDNMFFYFLKKTVSGFLEDYEIDIALTSYNEEESDHALTATAGTKEKRAVPLPVKKYFDPSKENVFIVTKYLGVPKDMKKLIEDTFPGRFNVHIYTKISTLKNALTEFSPDIAIIDPDIDDDLMLSQLCGMIQAKNPSTGLIITHGEAALLSLNNHIPGIMAFIEKPFYLAGVIDAINGVRDRNIQTAKARFEISQAGRIAADIKRPMKNGIIKLWKGYAGPGQEDLITKIRKDSACGPYKIEFADIDELVAFACDSSSDKENNTVAIMPSSASVLGEARREALRAAGANIIYMDVENDDPLSSDTVLNLSAMALTGIAYVEGDDKALTRLYHLLTNDTAAVTIAAIKNDPLAFIMKLTPIKALDYEQVKELNALMRKVLASA